MTIPESDTNSAFLPPKPAMCARQSNARQATLPRTPWENIKSLSHSVSYINYVLQTAEAQWVCQYEAKYLKTMEIKCECCTFTSRYIQEFSENSCIIGIPM